jgi:hypothetical protein
MHMTTKQKRGTKAGFVQKTSKLTPEEKRPGLYLSPDNPAAASVLDVKSSLGRIFWPYRHGSVPIKRVELFCSLNTLQLFPCSPRMIGKRDTQRFASGRHEKACRITRGS